LPNRLPRRLAAVADALATYVGPEAVVADIGAGRGELSLYLARRELCGRAIATDISAKAVRILADLVGAQALDDAVSVRCGDGLAAIRPGEADAVVLAGIGGRLAIRLLADGLPLVHCAERPALGPVVIAQPMSHPRAVRDWAVECAPGLGYELAGERLALDAGRYYHTFVLLPARWRRTGARGRCLLSARLGAERRAATRAVFDVAAYQEIGPFLLAWPDPLMRGWLEWRLRGLARLCASVGEANDPPGQARLRSARRLASSLAAARAALDYVAGPSSGGVPAERLWSG
jgi:tRNA A22 N-methylase